MRLRLILSFILVVLISTIGIVLFIRLNAARQVQNFMFGGGMIGADRLVLALENYYQKHNSWDEVQTLLRQSSGMIEGQGRQGGMRGLLNNLVLADANGRVVYDTTGTWNLGDTLPESLLGPAIQLKDQKQNTIGYLAVPGDTPSLSRGVEQPLLQNLNNVALRAGLIATFLAILVALWLSSRLLRPVQQLTQAAEKLSAGDLSQQVPVEGKDELSTLAKTFNLMTESLRQSESRRQAMTADIAHELRTPLAVQRAYLEALQDGIYPLKPANLQPILDQTELLSRLVEDLRTLALADSGELHLEKTSISIIDLAQDILKQFNTAAMLRRVQLELVIQPQGSQPAIMADPDRLRQILNNLLSNALRHTPEDGQVKILVKSSHLTKKWVEVQVIDNGPGIPEDSLSHIFERFYRADRSRSRDEGGTGLGLAIARQLTLAHGGQLTAGNRPEGGAIFTLRLPIA